MSWTTIAHMAALAACLPVPQQRAAPESSRWVPDCTWVYEALRVVGPYGVDGYLAPGRRGQRPLLRTEVARAVAAAIEAWWPIQQMGDPGPEPVLPGLPLVVGTLGALAVEFKDDLPAIGANYRSIIAFLKWKARPRLPNWTGDAVFCRDVAQLSPPLSDGQYHGRRNVTREEMVDALQGLVLTAAEACAHGR